MVYLLPLPRDPERPSFHLDEISALREDGTTLVPSLLHADVKGDGPASERRLATQALPPGRHAGFSGPVPYDDVKLYAARGNSIRVFNASGMEIYRFDVDPRPGTVFDLAVDEPGDILRLTLSFDPAGQGAGWFITRCDYRGQPIGRIMIAGLPRDGQEGGSPATPQ